MPTPDQATERASIVAAAYRLLAGSDGASVPIMDILHAAGLSTRAFYRHFDSKDALLLAMFRTDSERFLNELSTLVAEAPTARDALERWITHHLEVVSERRRRQHLVVLRSDEVKRARGYQAEAERYRVAQDEALTSLLRRGIADGTLPLARPERDARYIRAALGDAFAELMDRSPGSDGSDVLESLLDFADRALGAAPGTPRER